MHSIRTQPLAVACLIIHGHASIYKTMVADARHARITASDNVNCRVQGKARFQPATRWKRELAIMLHLSA
jgi:hypothetical protein